MNGKTLSEALGGLPEAMVAEAMEPPGKRNHSFWLRLAACIALIVGLFFGLRPDPQGIVTAPGILAVTVYAVDEDNEAGFVAVPINDGIVLNKQNYTPLGMSSMRGVPIHLAVNADKLVSDQVRYEISVSCGEYYGADWHLIEGKGNDFSIGNETTIYWDISDEDYRAGTSEKPEYDHVYTDIVIYEGEHIVGYAVVRFDRLYGKEFMELNSEHADLFPYDDEDPVGAYYSTIVKSVWFPKVNNAYQNISLDYVEKCLESVVR